MPRMPRTDSARPRLRRRRLAENYQKKGRGKHLSDLPASTCGLGNTYCREQTRRLHHIQPANTLRITSQAMSAAVSFWHSLSNGRRIIVGDGNDVTHRPTHPWQLPLQHDRLAVADQGGVSLQSFTVYRPCLALPPSGLQAISPNAVGKSRCVSDGRNSNRFAGNAPVIDPLMVLAFVTHGSGDFPHNHQEPTPPQPRGPKLV
jgi:hypothetical protein